MKIKLSKLFWVAFFGLFLFISCEEDDANETDPDEVEADSNERLFGSWVVVNEPGSLGVGPAPGDVSFFSIDEAGLAQRACYFNDTYIFGDDGSFTNNLGEETWLEGWQNNDTEACGVPVAPHDGSASATYSFDETAGTLTISGAGAYLGLPKAVNSGELPNVDVPDSITYEVSLSDDGNSMDVLIEAGSGIFWQYKMEKGDGSDVIVNDDDGDGDGSMPTMAATDPTQDAADVISMFSNVYDDVVVDTWRTDWSDATFEDVQVDGNDVKKYSNLNFVGIETVTNQIDATGTNLFHVDIWTADATEFRIKLVDFGEDGAFDGGDDVEHEVTIPAPAQGEWVSLDIPLSDFVGLTKRSNIAQLIFSGNPSGAFTVFIDNIYFYSGDDTSSDEILDTVFTNLVWADEFDADGAPDPANWGYDLGNGDNGWGNGEIQSYTSDATNVIVEGGNLKITARAEEATGEGVYYFDDFQLLDAGGMSQSVIEDFEGDAPSFTDFGGAFSAVIDNPDASGVNTSATVGQTTKPQGSETFAASFFDVSPAIDVPNNPTISVKTWSPIANAVVRLKIEDSNDGNNFAEVDATTTTAGAWEELTFDFSGAANFNYDRVVIFFDFGNAGTAGSAYSSARIKSEGLQEFTYGRVETRAKLPTGGGTWPAIWMLGADYETNPWPGAGEMDILEHVGNSQDIVFASTHDPNNFGGNARTGSVLVDGASDEFHVYEMEWTETEIKFAVDGVVFHTVSNDGTLPFNKDFFFIINVAMGGNFGGDIDPAFTESTLEVDYIRMYQ